STEPTLGEGIAIDVLLDPGNGLCACRQLALAELARWSERAQTGASELQQGLASIFGHADDVGEDLEYVGGREILVAVDLDGLLAQQSVHELVGLLRAVLAHPHEVLGAEHVLDGRLGAGVYR